MANKEMKTLTFGNVTYEVVDEKARNDINNTVSKDKIGGEQLGLVKNGGNVTINLDGTMTVSDGDVNVQSDWNESTETSDAFIKNKPNIKVGSGEKSIVIGDGDATGDYSVAGGTNDKNLVADLVGSGLLAGLANIETSEAQGAMSLAFGAGNKAITAGTTAIGANSTAGCKGFYFWSIDFNTKVITLSTNQKPIILGSRKWTDEAKTQLGNWAVNDIISIVNGSKYVLCSKITAIDSTAGTITVDTLPFTKVETQITPIFDDYSVTCPSKPTIGIVDQGLGAFAIGLENKASGSFSHVEGWKNLGAGDFSHVEGKESKAGYAAHAEGSNTTASGLRSHAEGCYTEAIGDDSHAEGYKTIASGKYSHAEGNQTTATKLFAHSEGYLTVASGDASHAEGSTTTASGEASHAEGKNTTASGKRSHAEGNQTIASGLYSHTEGGYTEASGEESHAEGSHTIASGTQSHAEGCYTEANSFCAHAEGYQTKASGQKSHAEGWLTEASGIHSHAEGKSDNLAPRDTDDNIITDISSLIEAHTEASFLLAFGECSHAEGLNTLALGEASHAEGYHTIASGLRSHAEGNQTTASEHCAHAEGCLTTASGNQAHAEGYGTKAEGYQSHAEGDGTKAIGEESHAEGKSTIAEGTRSHAEGYKTKAIGAASHTEGNGCIAKGTAQHAQGKWNDADDSNLYAHIVGGGSKENTLNTDGSINTKNRRNIHTLDWSGLGWFAKGTSAEGADYAEYFEWEDGNSDNEDRIGLLVSLDGEMMKLANSGDEILGVISGTAAMIGDNYECSWQGRYLTDDFGRIIYEDIEEFDEVITGEDEEGNPIVEEISLGFFKHPKQNPDYDPTKDYIRRSDRPEWDAVGMLGKLYVRDDGTATVNGYVTVCENGIATASSEKTNMRVLSRVNDNVIRVLLK